MSMVCVFVEDGFARFVLINPENSYDRSSVAKKIQFLWKTEAIKGILQVNNNNADTAIVKSSLLN